jgi:hypothetical protein
MVDVTDIKGVGPAKAELLEENGFDSVDAVLDADPDDLAEINGISEDRAIEYKVEAENLLEAQEEVEEETGDSFDLTPSELEGEEDEEEVEETDDAESRDDSEQSEESSDVAEDNGLYPVSIAFDNRRQYDTFHAALMRYHENIFTSNQSSADAMKKCLNGLDSFEEVSYELTEEELNTLHTAIKQTRTRYQGDNLIDHMDELNVIESRVDAIRREHLF